MSWPFLRSLLCALCLFAIAVGCRAQQPLSSATPAPLWTNDERKAIVAYWNAPGRYVIDNKPTDLPYRTNITVSGSEWYAKYVRALSDLRKTNPAQANEWNLWFEKRLILDMMEANKSPEGGLIIEYPRPDIQPQTLQTAIGEAPLFYEVVQPKRYTITFAPSDAPAPFVYVDNLNFLGPKPYYAYYRSTNGVRKFGKRLAAMSGPEKAEVAALFAKVASSPFEQHVLAAVSALEGGFDAVNTYDTGWVSIGFIQFITARNGNGSLSSVLANHKQNDPTDFAQTFHRFGIDVDGSGILTVCDPRNGTELHGKEAVDAVINDKRLTAVWERAGNLPGFRKAQVSIARQQYWPGDDTVSVTVQTLNEQTGKDAAPTVKGVYYTPTSGSPVPLPPDVQALFAAVPEEQKTDPSYQLFFHTDVLTAKVSEVVKSEAGMATLMDRKVNRGSLGPINEVAAQIMQQSKLTQIAQLAAYEKPLIEGMKYRANYLTDPALTQPPAPPKNAPISPTPPPPPSSE